eukprot:g965.t1
MRRVRSEGQITREHRTLWRDTQSQRRKPISPWRRKAHNNVTKMLRLSGIFKKPSNHRNWALYFKLFAVVLLVLFFSFDIFAYYFSGIFFKELNYEYDFLIDYRSKNEEYYDRYENLRPRIEAWRRRDRIQMDWIDDASWQNHAVHNKNVVATFVVPSRGRSTLHVALASLLNQDDPRWNAIVILNHNGPVALSSKTDGDSMLTVSLTRDEISMFIHSEAILQDSRISFRQLTTDLRVLGNTAGEMRNAAFELIDPDVSPWVAFVDDDDVVTGNYVSALAYEAAQHPGMDAILFPMRCAPCFAPVVPTPGTTQVEVNYVGISFALRSSLVNRNHDPVRFVPSKCEDYNFFSGLVESNLHARIAPNVTYHVKGGVKETQTRESIGDKSVRVQKGIPTQDPCIAPRSTRTTDLFVQYQMEQIASSGVTHGSNTYRPKLTSAYARRLGQAVEVWDFSRYNVRLLSDFELNIAKKDAAYFVPLAATLHTKYYQGLCERIDREGYPLDASEAYNLHSDLFPQNFQNISNEDIISFTNARYMSPSTVHTDQYRSRTQMWVKRWGEQKCIPEYRQERKGGNLRWDGVPCPTRADALLFGALTDSRKSLCRKVMAGVHDIGEVVCISELFGYDIERLICHSKVIFIDHAYPNGALEVHRILPLLAMGKAVVAVRSSDKMLDDEYSEVVRFVSSARQVPEVVRDLLQNNRARRDLESRALGFVSRRVEKASDHLCSALWSLDHLIISGASRPDIGEMRAHSKEE